MRHGIVRFQEELGFRAVPPALRVRAVSRARGAAGESDESEVPCAHRNVAPPSGRSGQFHRSVHRPKSGVAAPGEMLTMDRALTVPDPATATPPRRPLIESGSRAQAIALVAALTAILLIYLDTGASIVQIWRRSETFAHGWAVVPLSLWLVWHRRHALATVASPPCYLGLAAIALAGAGW